MSVLSEIGSSALLFMLIFGMSATVDINNLKKQLRNKNAIITGILLQFILFPFLGFAVVKALDLNTAEGITLLVVTSSPGGSYSNWWCSMFNADLALSVTMTAISTLMSIVFLPMNLIIYTRSTYEADVIHNVDWVSLFIALGIVISAIGLGLYCSASVHSPKFNIFANKLGSLSGLALVVYSIMISSKSNTTDESLWNRDWKFYFGVASPCVLGLAAANLISTSFRLKEPERVTVSVECCYQNVGIATSVAITMFQGKELSQAVGVPLFYGLVEAVVLGIYCITAWKIGWTKAPPNESFCTVIGKSYEVKCAQIFDLNAIEVVLGSPKDPSLDGDADLNEEDVLFEMDNSTVSVSDSDRENGSIYAISYPASKRKGSERRSSKKNKILLTIIDSPRITRKKADLLRKSFSANQRNFSFQRNKRNFEDKENSATDTNKKFYQDDLNFDRDLEAGNDLNSANKLFEINSSLQNQFENSPAESSISNSIQSESEGSLSNASIASQERNQSTRTIPAPPSLISSSSSSPVMAHPPLHVFKKHSSIPPYSHGKSHNISSERNVIISDDQRLIEHEDKTKIQSFSSSSSLSISIELEEKNKTVTKSDALS